MYFLIFLSAVCLHLKTCSQRCHFSDFNLKSDFLCPDLGTFIDFQPALDHFAQIYAFFSDFLADLSGISVFKTLKIYW